MDAGTTALGVAFFALCGTILTPLLTSHFNAKQAAKKQAADYARQDEVAERVTEAAEKVAEVAEQAREAARLLEERDHMAALLAEENAKVFVGKLDVIHTLVNSTLTGALEGHLLALRQLRTAMRGERPATADEIASADGRIVEVQSQLADRARQGG